MIRKRVYEIIEKAEDGDIPSTIFDYSIIILICLNIIAIIIGSYSSIEMKYGNILHWFEIISIIIFSIEYILRIWTSIYKYPNSKIPYLRFIFSFMAIIDLFAIIPFYLPFIGVDLRILRIFRLFRLFRLLKLNRYNNSLEIIVHVIKKQKEKIIMTLFATGLLIILSASLMFYIEHSLQPEKFPNIINTLWWAIATLTTADYGDVASMTIYGRILTGIIAILGIGLVALPSGIICSGLVEDMNKRKEKCPHCGKKL